MNINNILKELEFKPSKLLGQNFLNNKLIIHDVVEKLNINKNDYFIEIGPGLGSLTDIIYKKCKKLILIEKDIILYNFLKKKYENISNIIIYNFDILNFDFSILEKVKYRVIGNLPFNISIKILKKLLKEILFLLDLNLSFSEEVAKKLLSNPKKKEYSFISVFFASFFKIKSLYCIKPMFFIPKPKVTTLFLNFIFLRKKSPFLDKDFLNFVSICFLKKRKTLWNNLKKNFNIKDFEKFLKMKNYSKLIRSECLYIEDFVCLYNFLKK